MYSSRKYHYLPHQKAFFYKTPPPLTPLKMPIKLHTLLPFFGGDFLGFTEPAPTPRKLQFDLFCAGSMNISWNWTVLENTYNKHLMATTKVIIISTFIEIKKTVQQFLQIHWFVPRHHHDAQPWQEFPWLCPDCWTED